MKKAVQIYGTNNNVGDKRNFNLHNVITSIHTLHSLLQNIVKATQGCAYSRVCTCIQNASTHIHPRYKEVLMTFKKAIKNDDVRSFDHFFVKIMQLNQQIQCTVYILIQAHGEILRRPNHFCKIYPEESHVTRFDVEESQDSLRNMMFALFEVPESLMRRLTTTVI